MLTGLSNGLQVVNEKKRGIPQGPLDFGLKICMGGGGVTFTDMEGTKGGARCKGGIFKKKKE